MDYDFFFLKTVKEKFMATIYLAMDDGTLVTHY